MARAAEPQAVPPPQPPFVIQAPRGSQWSVEVEQPKEAAGQTQEGGGPNPVAKPAMPVRLNMKVGLNGVQQGTIGYSDGSGRSYYVVEGSLFETIQKSGRVLATAPGEESPYYVDSLWVTGFPALNWLAAKYYRGTEKLKDDLCYLFVGDGPAALPGGPESELRAWINTASGHPVKVQIGTQIYVFSQVTPFPQEISLPEAYRIKVEQIRRQNQALERIRQKN